MDKILKVTYLKEKTALVSVNENTSKKLRRRLVQNFLEERVGNISFTILSIETANENDLSRNY